MTGSTVAANMVNPGLVDQVDNDTRQAQQKTLVVLGTARGGTSALAGALDRLGLFTGALSDGPVYEDVNLSHAIESGTTEQVQSVIAEYNRQYPVWAYKRPRLLYHVEEVHPLLRNPLYLVVFRDVFAGALRTRISGQVASFRTMDKLLGDNTRILDFLERSRPPALLISYEKLMARPEFFIDALIGLLPFPVAASARQAAIEFIQPAPADYLDATRTTKALGEITGLSHNCVQGWARYSFPLKPAAVLTLHINGEACGSVTADLDGNALGLCEQTLGAMPADISCGFRFELPDGRIRSGDEILVQASEDITPLAGSPVIARLDPREATGDD
ncbi:MAG: hypothetical protein V2J89_01950 [Halieaceae bacterium]|jgi:pimeloyl-ACP methyl ester carboxylesterase|nr:hypothetical protein [Halieaceae bacterium]